MSREVAAFIESAMQIGLGAKLAALKADVEAAIVRYPFNGDKRYLRRLEDQLDRLNYPDLRLIGVLVRGLCEEEPSRHAGVAVTIDGVAGRLPDLAAWSRQQRRRQDDNTARQGGRAA